MEHDRNRAREGQCTRDPRCTNGKGHAGWCKTKPGSDVGQDQDSLFASLSRRCQPTRTGGAKASRAEGMKELAAALASGALAILSKSEHIFEKSFITTLAHAYQSPHSQAFKPDYIH